MSAIRSPPMTRKIESKHAKLDKNNLLYFDILKNHEDQNNKTSKDCDNDDFHAVNYNNNSKLINKKILSDQLWYHGLIKRVETQRLLRYDGDFLVRESISSGPGRYVLSGLWEKKNVHFEINEYKLYEGDYSISLFHVSFFLLL